MSDTAKSVWAAARRLSEPEPPRNFGTPFTPDALDKLLGNSVFADTQPTAPHATGTEAAVCEDIASRQQHGIAKYGTTVQDNPLPLRAWLQHAYEECLDQAVYLKRAIAQLDADQQGKKALSPKGPLCGVNELPYCAYPLQCLCAEKDADAQGKKA